MRYTRKELLKYIGELKQIQKKHKKGKKLRAVENIQKIIKHNLEILKTTKR